MTLGVFVTLYRACARHDQSLPFVYIAPIVAAIGLAFLYGPGLVRVEIEVAAHLAALECTRLMLVFGFNLGLGDRHSALAVMH
jgi:hypothetical protein